MGRIEEPSPLPELVALTAPAGGAPPITIVALAHCEELLSPFLGWARALALNGVMPRRDHEILAMRTAHNCHSEFEWTEHASFARRAGLTDEEIDAIASGTDVGWSVRERLLLTAADELHAEFSISPDTWAALAEHCSTAELVEAIYVVGQYTMLSMVANVVEGE
jgi:alkylhydroperoxidase family enzyme